MKRKREDEPRYSGPVTAAIEPPKPKVLTREELHKAVDSYLRVATFADCDAFSPVVIQKFQYDGFLKDANRAKEEIKWLQDEVFRLQERLDSRRQERLDSIRESLEYAEGSKAAPQKTPKPAGIISKEFLAFKREQRKMTDQHADT